MAKASGGLSRWFKEEWVDLSRPKKGGGFEPCGRPDADEGKYPKCVPKAKAMKMTQAEIDSAVRRKRRAESTEERKGKKPINVPTEVEKKSKDIPANPKLYAKVKAEAKRKFDVYPSAYANGWLVQEYKRRGGTYKTVTKQQPDSSEVHVPSTNWKFKRKKRGLSSLVDKHAEHDQKSHGSWANGYQQRLFGEPEERYGVKRSPSRLEELGMPSNLTGLISELEEESTRDIPMSEEEFLASYDLEASDYTVDGGTKVTQVIDSDGNFQGYFLTYEVNGETSVAYEKEFQEVSYRLDIEDMVVEQVPDWRREYVNGRPLYHGTTLDHVASIAESGLESRNDTRGMSNRQIGSAVFLSAEPGYSMDYGEVLIEVDMDRLLADGVLSAEDAFPEPNVLDAQVLQGIAYNLDEYDYVPEVGLEAYPETTVIFEGPGVVIPPEYMTVDGTPLTDYAASISKHAEHDQKSHGNWAQGTSNPKPYAGKGKKLKDGHPPRPLPEVGDRIGIHLDLTGAESGLGKGNAFSIKMVGEGGAPDYSITQAHSLGVRLSNVGSDVNRRILADAIKYDKKNPHAAFTGTVEEWVNSREVPKGAVEIDYWVRPKAKNPDGTDRYTAETTGFWYVKDGTYREFIGASDGIGIGGDRSPGGDKARTYVYGDVELGEVNPYVKEWFEEQKLTKAHRLIHESRTRQRPFELAKHADHDQQSHGSWADARSGQPDRPEGLGTYRPPAEFDDRIGRCYELSWRTVSKMPERGRLVHGSIQGAGNERIPHSWTEVDDLAYDPVMDEWFPADFYRSLVNAEVAEEYTKDEVNMIVRREMNMGPWHKEPYGTQWYEERGL